MTNHESAANRVLASIPPSDHQRLRSQLGPITVDFGQVLFEPGQAIRPVYFPVDCLISLLTAVGKRRSLEVGMVGNEGMAGMPFILGMGVSGVRAFVQGGGNALRMASAPFRIEFDRNRALQHALYRYTYALMALMAMFVIALGVGCLTGIVVMLSSRNRRTGRSTNAPPFRASSSND